ncbi:MAG TPA: ABC transporter ATP-binding protein [Verrucomicrobiae bacterium]|nr:ABC transporter ATP-binding protein [Verrucomicrobiae bacterium]
MAETLLQLSGVSKEFVPAAGAAPLKILSNLDLVVAPGESLAIVGPSGSGKSTLLNLIGSLDRPTTGKVLLGGQDLTSLDEKQLAKVRNQRIGFIFQGHHLLPQCSVLENVLVPTLAEGAAGADDNALQRAKALLQRVGLGERLNHRPAQLSGGERQRTAVVRALINQPQLLLADEPTGALDQASAANLADLLVELNREEKVALIVVTHSPTLAARMGRALELRGGRLEPKTDLPR